MKTGNNSTTPGKALSRPDREGFLVPDLERKDLRQFGQYLRRERDLRGITLEEIARTTRINQRYLAAIEEGRDDILPAVPFVKGFITAYARHIGLNPEEVLGFFDEVRGIKVDGTDEVPEPPSPGRAGRWFLAAGVLLVLAAGAAFWWSRSGSEGPPVLPLATPAAPDKAPEREQAQAPAPSGQIAPPRGSFPRAAGGVELVLEAAEKSWVYAIIDEHNVRDFFLKPGEKSELKAGREIKLTLGNAGGVGVTFNGKKIGALGKLGEVKRDVIFIWDAARGPELRDPFSKSEEKTGPGGGLQGPLGGTGEGGQ